MSLKHGIAFIVASLLLPNVVTGQEERPSLNYECSSFDPAGYLGHRADSSILLPQRENATKTNPNSLKSPAPNFDQNKRILGNTNFTVLALTDAKDPKIADCIAKQQAALDEYGRKSSKEYKDLFDWFEDAANKGNSSKDPKERIDVRSWVQLLDNRSGLVPKTSEAMQELGFISEEFHNDCTIRTYKSFKDTNPISTEKQSTRAKMIVLTPRLTSAWCSTLSAKDIPILLKHWKKEIEEGRWQIGPSNATSAK